MVDKEKPRINPRDLTPKLPRGFFFVMREWTPSIIQGNEVRTLSNNLPTIL